MGSHAALPDLGPVAISSGFVAVGYGLCLLLVGPLKQMRCVFCAHAMKVPASLRLALLPREKPAF